MTGGPYATDATGVARERCAALAVATCTYLVGEPLKRGSALVQDRTVLEDDARHVTLQ